MPRYDVEVWLRGGSYMADGYYETIEAPDPETAKARFMLHHMGVRGWQHFAGGQGVTVREVVEPARAA